jgi:hypothetical protein
MIMNTATMERQETLTATVTVAYVNPPKAEGKPGNIKASDGQYYSIWTPGLLEQFQQGETVYVDYRVKNGFRTVIARRPVVQEPRPQQPQQQRSAPVQQHVTPPTNGNGNGYRPVDERTAKRMFLCSTFAAFVHAGRVERNRDAMAETLDMLSEVYDEKIGTDAG